MFEIGKLYKIKEEYKKDFLPDVWLFMPLREHEDITADLLYIFSLKTNKIKCYSLDQDYRYFICL